MFQGFSDETFEFFMAVAFNNNTEFFHDNRDWYLRAVREPCLALAEALAGTIEAIDGSLERRPNRVVSRINRDIRFSRDKSPYRDYMWLSFHHTGEDRHTQPGFYWEISARGAACGMGIYEGNRPLLNGLRRSLLAEPDAFLKCWTPVRQDFRLVAQCFKRMKPPEALHPALVPWYPLRSFYLEKDIGDFNLIKSPALAEEIAEGFQRLTPLYRFFKRLQPAGDADTTKTDRPSTAAAHPSEDLPS